MKKKNNKYLLNNFKFYLVFLPLVLIFFQSFKNLNSKNLDFQNIYIDSVEKSYVKKNQISEDYENLFLSWFNNYLKVDGFEGLFLISIDNYSENILKIDNGKKIEIKIIFNVVLENKAINKKLKINISEHSSITGSFSINDFENLIYNTQINSIKKLSEKLSEEFSFSKS